MSSDMEMNGSRVEWAMNGDGSTIAMTTINYHSSEWIQFSQGRMYVPFLDWWLDGHSATYLCRLNAEGNGVDAIDSLNVLSPQSRRTQRSSPPRIAADDPTQIGQQFRQHWHLSILLAFLSFKHIRSKEPI